MQATPNTVRRMLYDYPDLKAEYTVTWGGGPKGEGVQGGGPGRPVEAQAIRLENLSHKIERVDRLLAHLTATEYVLVRLRYFEGLPFTSIARMVKAAASTVWSRDKAIIDKLVKALNDNEGSGH